MLEIAQTGQAGKTSLLFSMHRLRKRVFKDRMGWDVRIEGSGLEVDQFDLPEAVYLLALDDERHVIGTWRLLPCDGPIMIREVWPQFLDSIEIPFHAHAWEASRFAVDSRLGHSAEGLAQVNRATQELFCGLTELCLLCGIEQVFTLYDLRIARLLKRLDCQPDAVSKRLSIAGLLAQVGSFTTDRHMLARLRAATRIQEPLVTPDMVPPALRHRLRAPVRAERTEEIHAAL
jgi:acyl homoserine lactone synthase